MQDRTVGLSEAGIVIGIGPTNQKALGSRKLLIAESQSDCGIWTACCLTVKFRIKLYYSRNGKYVVTMGPPEISSKAFDVVLGLASITYMAYLMFRTADVSVDQGNHLVPV